MTRDKEDEGVARLSAEMAAGPSQAAFSGVLDTAVNSTLASCVRHVVFEM